MMFRALAVSLVWMLSPATAQGQGVAATYPDFNERTIFDVPTEVRRYNTAANLELVQSRIDRIQQSRNARNPISLMGEWAMLVTPFAFSMAETGIVGEQASVWENIFSGQRARQESREFRRAVALMPPEEFGPYLEELDNRIRKSTTVGAVHNKLLNKIIWNQMLDAMPAAIKDAFNVSIILIYLSFIIFLMRFLRRIMLT